MRTKLADRQLPDYTRAEEIFNMVSHIVGGAFGIVALVLCVIKSAGLGDAYAVVSSAIYGVSLISLYTISSVYHGLRPERAKKVLQVLDHCFIYFLIVGSYMPFCLVAIRRVSAAAGWVIFGVKLALPALAVTFTAIDWKRYNVLSMCCYIVMGWGIIGFYPLVIEALTPAGFALLLAGGAAYTIGAVLYGIGSKKRWMHCVFHVFVLIGTALHFMAIWNFVLV